MTNETSRRFGNQIFRYVTVLVGLLLAWDLLSHLEAEILWFEKVGYLSVFLKRLQTQLGAWTIACIISAGFLFGNLVLAHRLDRTTPSPNSESSLIAPLQKPQLAVRRQGIADRRGYDALPQRDVSESVPPDYAKRSAKGDAFPRTVALNLRSLLPAVILLSLLVGVMLLHYSNIALSLWHPDFSLPDITPPMPSPFEWASLRQLFPMQTWQPVVLVVIGIALIVKTRFWLNAIAAVLSLFFALVVSAHWGRIWQYFNPTAFNANEPVFGRDISFYIFSFPVWQLLDFWLGGLCLFGLVAVALIYLVSGDSLSEGKFLGFSPSQLRHLYGLGAAVAASGAFRHWLDRYELLYSTRGVSYGASYTDVSVQLPAQTGLSLLAGAIALFLLVLTISSLGRYRTTSQAVLVIVGLYLTVLALAGIAIPATVQRFNVQPNELVRERPYIERSIALTRAAFDLADIDVESFIPQGQLTSTDLNENDLTIRNIRLWDSRPILQTNRQLQQIRPYYRFPDADIDRYTLKVGATGVTPSFEGNEDERPEERRSRGTEENSLNLKSPPFTPEKQQVIIAARELDYSAVPEQAKTWVNKHLVYTHGYGFTLSPVNTAGEGGLPNYFVKDIGTGTDASQGALSTSSPLLRESIPIGQPRIYYGQLTDTYVMTSTKAREFDYPSGEDNVYNSYDGTGGIALRPIWRRVLFAQYLKDWQMLFTRNFTPQTKVLFRRNINQRIRAIAPFLRYDRDPYFVTVNAGGKESVATPNYLYWIVDAYTTSDRYPYSDPGKHEFNYIRNSVKVVIDAYNGDVDFYVADPDDPIIQTWAKIFPTLFKPLDAMPAALRSHIRYPVDLFSVQSERLLIYHMTDPQVFYNREDLWQIPQEIYGSEPQAVEPYYLILKLPTTQTEEFILLLPFTPTQRTNLIAWLAARSDGDAYGKLLLYRFPKQELIYGTEQIEALINQDPVISQQISLWNRQGSRALQGNLLVIPIERSLLYVEPLYLEAEQNSLPTLVRVIVVYENRIVMAQTLEQALQAIFQPAQQPTPTIIRPVNEPNVPLEQP